jgi:hypothetical protein
MEPHSQVPATRPCGSVSPRHGASHVADGETASNVVGSCELALQCEACASINYIELDYNLKMRNI